MDFVQVQEKRDACDSRGFLIYRACTRNLAMQHNISLVSQEPTMVKFSKYGWSENGIFSPKTYTLSKTFLIAWLYIPASPCVCFGRPKEMFRFPSPSLSWRWFGRSGKKKEWTHEGFWVLVNAGLLSTKAWLRGHFIRNQMVGLIRWPWYNHPRRPRG